MFKLLTIIFIMMIYGSATALPITYKQFKKLPVNTQRSYERAVLKEIKSNEYLEQLYINKRDCKKVQFRCSRTIASESTCLRDNRSNKKKCSTVTNVKFSNQMTWFTFWLALSNLCQKNVKKCKKINKLNSKLRKLANVN